MDDGDDNAVFWLLIVDAVLFLAFISPIVIFLISHWNEPIKP